MKKDITYRAVVTSAEMSNNNYPRSGPMTVKLSLETDMSYEDANLLMDHTSMDKFVNISITCDNTAKLRSRMTVLEKELASIKSQL